MKVLSADVKFGSQKCPVYLKLPWIGDSSLHFESQIKQAITNCFFAVNPRVTKKALPSIQKDCVPATQKVPLFMNLRASAILAT